MVLDKGEYETTENPRIMYIFVYDLLLVYDESYYNIAQNPIMYTQYIKDQYCLCLSYFFGVFFSI